MWTVLLCVVLAADSFSPDEELYVRGSQYFDRGDFGSAAKAFEELIRRFPSSHLVCPGRYALAEAYYSLQYYPKALAQIEQVGPCAGTLGQGRVRWRTAWILYQLRRLPEAQEAFRQASVSQDLPREDRIAASIMTGDLAAEMGKAAEALAIYRSVSQQSMSVALSCQVYYKIGSVALSTGALQEAQAAFASVIQLDPTSEFADDALYGRGWALRRMKLHQQAVQMWTRLVSDYPQSPLAAEARFRLGEEWYSLGKYPEAIAAFSGVPQYSDFADDALYWKAWAEYRMGLFAKAAYTFGMVRAQFPSSPVAADAQFRAAEAHREAGEYELAFRGYRALLEMNPGDEYLAESLYGLAQSAAFSGNHSEAESYRTQLLATGKAGDLAPKVYFDLGVAAFNRKQYPRAIREFTSLVKQYPTHPLAPEAWYYLGLAHLREEQWTEARQAFLKCLEHAPPDLLQEATYQLGWAYFRAGDYARAREHFLSVSRMGGPKAADARYRAGDALYNEGRYPEAIQVYQEVIAMAPGTELAASAQNSIGWCYERLGQYSEAVGAFRAVVERYPRSQVWDDSAYKVAEYYHRTGDKALSIPVLELLVAEKASPFWESAVLMLAQDLWDVHRRAEARRVAGELAQRREATLRPDALLLLAQWAWDAKEWDQARREYATFAQDYPTHELSATALLRVAEAHLETQNWEQALDAFARAKAAGAHEPSCLAGTSRALAMLGRCSEAEREATRMENQFPTESRTADAQFWAGNCYLTKGDDENAARVLLKVPILYPDHDRADDALLLAARARLRQGRKEQAERHLSSLLELYPGSDLKPQAERLLASIRGNKP